MGDSWMEMDTNKNVIIKINEIRKLKFEKIDRFVYLDALTTHVSNNCRKVEANMARGNKSTASLNSLLMSKQVLQRT